jgi:RNA polymerase-binding transcription factor DksA
MSTHLGWSDHRTRSRFTTAGGPAATAIPLADFRHVLEQLHAEAMNDAAIPDRPAGMAPSRDDRGSTHLQRLDEIEAAQQRIVDGSYGVCFGCGQRIPLARLKALPCVRYCLDCSMQKTGTSPTGQDAAPALSNAEGRSITKTSASQRLQSQPEN